MNKVTKFCLLIALALITLPAFSQSDKAALSEKQKTEIEKLIREYLISNPKVMHQAISAWQKYQEAQREVQARERLANMSKAVVANKGKVFQSKHDFSIGNKDGDVTMVEFFDYNCGFCKRALGDVLTLLETDKKLRLVVKELPILGPDSIYAARAALASKKQGKYWAFHVALMRTPGVNKALVLSIAKKVGLDTDRLEADMKAPDVDQAIEANLALARTLGVDGTPAFVVADKPIPGALGLKGLRAQIADVRARGGCKIC